VPLTCSHHQIFGFHGISNLGSTRAPSFRPALLCVLFWRRDSPPPRPSSILLGKLSYSWKFRIRQRFSLGPIVSHLFLTDLFSSFLPPRCARVCEKKTLNPIRAPHSRKRCCPGSVVQSFVKIFLLPFPGRSPSLFLCPPTPPRESSFLCAWFLIPPLHVVAPREKCFRFSPSRPCAANCGLGLQAGPLTWVVKSCETFFRLDLVPIF